MITEHNLNRAGFTPGEWQGLEDGGRYRDWELTISDKLKILVCQEQITGKEAFIVDFRWIIIKCAPRH